MIYKNYFFSAYLLLCFLLLAGCFRSPSSLKRFPSIEKTEAFCQTHVDLTILVKELTKEDCKQYFSVDLIEKGYIPLQIRVENQGSCSYVIRSNYLDLPLANSQTISKLLHWDTSLFVCAAGYPALLFWWPATFFVARSGYDMYKSNRQTNKLVKKACLENEHEDVTIKPYDVLNRFVFVRASEYTGRFSFKLYNEDEKKLVIFSVNCRQAEPKLA